MYLLREGIHLSKRELKMSKCQESVSGANGAEPLHSCKHRYSMPNNRNPRVYVMECNRT